MPVYSFLQVSTELVTDFFDHFESRHPTCERSPDGRTLRAGDVVLEWDPDACAMELRGEDIKLVDVHKFLPMWAPGDERPACLQTPEGAKALAELRRRAGLPA